MRPQTGAYCSAHTIECRWLEAGSVGSPRTAPAVPTVKHMDNKIPPDNRVQMIMRNPSSRWTITRVGYVQRRVRLIHQGRSENRRCRATCQAGTLDPVGVAERIRKAHPAGRSDERV